MYTEIYVNVDLKTETPPEIIEVLKAICGDGDESALEGKPGRWCMLFNSGSYYTPNTSCKNLTYDKIGNRWSLLGKGDIKNYEREIEQFFEWLSPWIDAEEGDFIGYTRYEEISTPTLVLLANARDLAPPPQMPENHE
jgi:hypothetical protein